MHKNEGAAVAFSGLGTYKKDIELKNSSWHSIKNSKVACQCFIA